MSDKLFIEHKFKDMTNQIQFLHDFCREGEYFHKLIQENGGNPDYLHQLRTELRSVLTAIKTAQNHSVVE